jgi:hypothetical protein
MAEMKTIKITKDCWASPDGVRILKYEKDMVVQFAEDVATFMVEKTKDAEWADGAQPTETQPVPAVEDVARPGESVTGGSMVASRNPVVQVGPQPVLVPKEVLKSIADEDKVADEANPAPNAANSAVPKGATTVNDASTPQTRTAATEGAAPADKPARHRTT